MTEKQPTGSTNNLSVPEQRNFHGVAELYSPWKNIGRNRAIKKSVVSLITAAFPGIPVDFDKTLSQFTDRRSTAILLRSKGEIIGLSYAIPIGMEADRRAADTQTAFVRATAIHPDFQHQGFLRGLLKTLDKELIKKGYSYVERDARMDNGYAEKLEKIYETCIEDKQILFHPERLLRLRIKL